MGEYTHWADYLVSCVLVKGLLKIRTKITEKGREGGRGEARREGDKREGEERRGGRSLSEEKKMQSNSR